MTARSLLAVATILAAALTPRPAAAQTCARTGVGAGGYFAAVHYDMAGGVDGHELGGLLRGGVGGVAMEAAAGRVLLTDGRPEPDVARVTVRVPVETRGDFVFCLVGHAGASRFSAAPDDGQVIAGGAGVAVRRVVALGSGSFVPFAEGRGLWARSTGEILGLDTGATGRAFGGEAGAELAYGPVWLRGSASFDGFADGLGPTAYPTRALRLEAGLRF